MYIYMYNIKFTIFIIFFVFIFAESKTKIYTSFSTTFQIHLLMQKFAYLLQNI